MVNTIVSRAFGIFDFGMQAWCSNARLLHSDDRSLTVLASAALTLAKEWTPLSVRLLLLHLIRLHSSMLESAIRPAAFNAALSVPSTVSSNATFFWLWKPVTTG